MKKDRYDSFMKYVFLAANLFSIFALLLISFFLFKNGLSIFKEISLKDFLLGRVWAPTDLPASFGIFPMIVTSIYTSLGAILLAAPIGIATAIFLVYFSKDSYYDLLQASVNLMAGIPSIIYGFFGLNLMVPLFQKLTGRPGNNIFIASILLAIMILPTIIKISESALRSVDKSYYEGALALSASKEEAIFKVVLPAASSGVISSIILGIGRALGETMALVMVAGNQARIPKNIMQGGRSLTANIVMEMSYASGIHREALIATALVLFIFTFLLNIIFSLVKKGELK